MTSEDYISLTVTHMALKNLMLAKDRQMNRTASQSHIQAESVQRLQNILPSNEN